MSEVDWGQAASQDTQVPQLIALANTPAFRKQPVELFQRNIFKPVAHMCSTLKTGILWIFSRHIHRSIFIRRVAHPWSTV
jgi:hypothetical protein